jgi:hypothetical protein
VCSSDLPRSPLSCHPERSVGSAFLCPLSQKRAVLSPLPAILTSHRQPPENKITLGPAVAILDAASSLTPLFATLTKNTRGWGTSASFLCVSSAYSASPRYLFLSSKTVSCKLSAVSVRPVTPNSFIIRTSAKRARNSSRIRTSKTRHLNSFRIRTYEKTGEGSPAI